MYIYQGTCTCTCTGYNCMYFCTVWWIRDYRVYKGNLTNHCYCTCLGECKWWSKTAYTKTTVTGQGQPVSRWQHKLSC